MAPTAGSGSPGIATAAVSPEPIASIGDKIKGLITSAAAAAAAAFRGCCNRGTAEAEPQQSVASKVDAGIARAPKRPKRPKGLEGSAVSLNFLKEFCIDVPKGFSTYDVVSQIVRPKTMEKRCPYVEVINNPSHVGATGWFISHAWAHTFHNLVEAIIEHFAGHDPASTYVWIDAFAIPQHPGKQQSDGLARLGDVIEYAQGTVVVLGRRAKLLTRVWCLYELWQTVQLKSEDALHFLTPHLSDTRDVWAVIHSVDVASAEATVEADKRRILDDIALNMGSLENLNRVIRRAVFLKLAAEVGYEEEHPQPGSPHDSGPGTPTGAAVQGGGTLLPTQSSGAAALLAAAAGSRFAAVAAVARIAEGMLGGHSREGGVAAGGQPAAAGDTMPRAGGGVQHSLGSVPGTLAAARTASVSNAGREEQGANTTAALAGTKRLPAIAALGGTLRPSTPGSPAKSSGPGTPGSGWGAAKGLAKVSQSGSPSQANNGSPAGGHDDSPNGSFRPISAPTGRRPGVGGLNTSMPGTPTAVARQGSPARASMPGAAAAAAAAGAFASTIRTVSVAPGATTSSPSSGHGGAAAGPSAFSIQRQQKQQQQQQHKCSSVRFSGHQKGEQCGKRAEFSVRLLLGDGRKEVVLHACKMHVSMFTTSGAAGAAGATSISRGGLLDGYKGKLEVKVQKL